MRPDHISRLYVVLVAWAIDRGCVDVLRRSSTWTHELGAMRVVADDRAFHLLFAVEGEPARVATITATEEHWEDGFEPLVDIVLPLLAQGLRGQP